MRYETRYQIKFKMDRAEVKNRTRTRSLSRRKSSRRRTIIKRGQRPPNANDFDAF